MQKIILTAVAAVALTSNAFAKQDGTTYLRSGLGYVSSETELSNVQKSKVKKIKGLAGVINTGYMFNEMLGVEGFVDYSATHLKNKNTRQKVSNKFTEIRSSLGSKALVQHTLDDKLSVNAGVGTGVTVKVVQHTFLKTTTDRDNKEVTKLAQLASKKTMQPFGLASLGADYTIGDGIAIGVEYSVKLSSKGNYKNEKEVLNPTDNYGISHVESARQNATFARSGRVSHAVSANVKFVL